MQDVGHGVLVDLLIGSDEVQCPFHLFCIQVLMIAGVFASLDFFRIL
jgi:hypothetical protein